MKKYTVEISGSLFEVEGANGVPTSILIERIDEDLSSRSAIKNHKEDAAFIVRAVNAHEELFTTLKAIADGRYIEGEEKEMAKQAIAKAEGK